MRSLKLLQAICLVVFVTFLCSAAGSRKVKNVEKEATMFEFKDVEYPVLFGNFQRNSKAPVTCDTLWRLAWTAEYAAVNPDFVLMPNSVLVNGSYVGVISSSDVFVYDKTGVFKYFFSISAQSPVVFGRDAIASIHPAYDVEYRGYDGAVIGHNGVIPKLKEWTSAVFLKPSDDEVLAIVQFNGGPLRKPRHYYAYRYSFKTRGTPWRTEGDGDVNQALLTLDGQGFVMLQGSKVSVLNVESGKIASGFEMTGLDPLTASLSPEGNLVVLGERTGESQFPKRLVSFSPEGEKLWEYSLLDPQHVQPPACGSDGRVYVVDSAQLKCIEKGAELWTQFLKSGDQTWLTVTADNSVIVLNGQFLLLFNPAGGKMRESLLAGDDETFNAPVAVDSEGRLYVAGNKKLYCFK